MLYKRLPIESTEPVNFVCYHPVVAARLPKFDRNFEPLEPTCLMSEYEYDSILGELCSAMGWQGGTIWQVIEGIKKLRKLQDTNLSKEFLSHIVNEVKYAEVSETAGSGFMAAAWYVQAFESWLGKRAAQGSGAIIAQQTVTRLTNAS